ncbi:MAG: hypothetical protein II661_06445, partial [Bacteroidales bacterium]|nr:hypothetical protein [Bacteroidales bacterium]
AKDPALYRLGFTQNTLPVAIFMHRMGISSDIIRKFMKQPVVKQIMQQYSSPASPGYHSIQKACDATVLYYAGQKGFTAKQASDTYKTIRKSGGLELRYSDLCQNIYKPESQGFEDILKTIHIFQSLQALQKTARNLDGFVRYNSSKAMKGSTFIDRYVKRAGLQTLKDNLSGDNPIFKLPQDVEINEEFLSEGEPFARLCSMFPYIAYTVLGENELTDSVILEHMHTYSPSFFAAAKQLKVEENAEVLRKLYAGWKNYLLFAGPKRIADFRDDIIAKGYTRIFADYYYAKLDELQREHRGIYDKVIAGNSFIESIYPVHAKDGYGDFEVLSTNVANLSGTSMEAYKRDWESLLLYPETRELATGLAIHFLARSAAFSRDTPVHLMPMAIREAIPNFADAFEDADKNLLSQDEVDQFIVTFLRNNINDETLVPHVRFSVDHPYVRYSIAPDAPVGTLRVRAGMIQDFISPAVDENGEKYFRLRTPVIHVLNQSTGQVQIYLAINDHVEPEKTVDKNGKEKIDIAIDAIPTTPLGIPYQMSEYTGNFMADSILLDEGQEAPDPDEAGAEDDPAPVQEPEVSEADVFSEGDVERGFATGTFIEA